jgi:hypothetical protein
MTLRFAALPVTFRRLLLRHHNHSAHIQYKYVVRNSDGSVVRWQEGDNVSLELPGGPAEALALDVEDSWNKSKQVTHVAFHATYVILNPLCWFVSSELPGQLAEALAWPSEDVHLVPCLSRYASLHAGH